MCQNHPRRTCKHEEYRFSEEDFRELDRESLYWHNSKDPSTWLCAATVQQARIEFASEL